jgi:RNA polymerase sigma-70 factor (ECF subfamily)
MLSASTSFESIGSTSSSLLERVKARDQDAWQRLVRLYGRLVLYWCRKANIPQADREDVFQEIFRSVARHVAEFHRDRPGDSFRGWLHSITQSKIADHFRRVSGQPVAPGGSEAYRQLQEVAAPDETGDDEQVSEESLVRHQAMALVREEFEERTWEAFWRVTVRARLRPQSPMPSA